MDVLDFFAVIISAKRRDYMFIEAHCSCAHLSLLMGFIADKKNVDQTLSL